MSWHDGFSYLAEGAVDVPVSGFEVPTTGAVFAKSFHVVGHSQRGDADNLLFNGNPLGNNLTPGDSPPPAGVIIGGHPSCNSTTDVQNDTVCVLGRPVASKRPGRKAYIASGDGRTPTSGSGVDMDVIRIPDRYLVPGSTAASLSIQVTGSDTLAPGMLAVSVDLPSVAVPPPRSLRRSVRETVAHHHAGDGLGAVRRVAGISGRPRRRRHARTAGGCCRTGGRRPARGLRVRHDDDHHHPRDTEQRAVRAVDDVDHDDHARRRPQRPTTTVPDGSSTTTTPDGSQPTTTTTTTIATTTTTTPPATSTSTTTTTTPSTPTTVAPPEPSTTTTTKPPPPKPAPTATGRAAPPRDPETEPKAPPVEAPSGRVVVPAGKVDPGQIRSITFPIAGPVTYGNDFGACRDGCTRAHKGNDLIGDRLQPLVAMHDGVIDHLVDHPTAGYGVVVRDSEGWEYRVYHMNNDTPGTDDAADGGAWRFAPGIVPGTAVKAGQFIGWMGDSGNSEGSVPHAHVEIHRPDGEAINPFWSLRLAQRDVNCAAGTPEPTRLDRIMALAGRQGRDGAALASPAGAGRAWTERTRWTRSRRGGPPSSSPPAGGRRRCPEAGSR